ncbi:cellulose binding domain-containing protein [Solwaraspora sp. WMMB335]|uniref:cellulose binding domain-containing protein n=1 Tax=Solwaraspora sp. WMMB335 TaxID=3404118 RepID=UPI003B924F88
MSTLPAGSSLRTDARRRPGRHRWWRTTARAAAALALAVGGGTIAAGGPAHATTATDTAATQASCLIVEIGTSAWRTGPDSGGYFSDVIIRNTCTVPVTGWTLVLTLPPGHTVQQGWNATWNVSGSTVTATPTWWNETVPAGGTVNIGYGGTWTGSPQEPGCTINGLPCDGSDPGPGPAPEVTLTSPTDNSTVVSVCSIRMTADASTEAGTIARVEFYVNDQLVGSDPTAPYGVDVPPDHPALRGGTGLQHTGFARVVTVSPAASVDSPTVRFGQAPPPPALMVTACPARVQVPDGGTATMAFVVTTCSATPGLVLTVTGNPGVSIAPTVTRPGSREHPVTITAAPGSAGAVARITAQPDSGSCAPATAEVTVGLPTT